MDRFLILLDALTWPIATVVIALIFRLDVTRALGRVHQFKFRGIELTFREDLRHAEDLARSIPPLLTGEKILEIDLGEAKPLGGQLISRAFAHSTPSTEPREALIELAGRSPREAVEEAWGYVDRALIRVALTLGDRRITGHLDAETAVRSLLDRGCLTSAEGQLARLLRNLGDRARLDHNPPSVEDARGFVNLAIKFAPEVERRA